MMGKWQWPMGVLIAAVLNSSAWCIEGEVVLESPKVALAINLKTAAVTRIENRLTSHTKNLRAQAFHLTTTRGELSPRNCQLVNKAHDGASATFDFSGNGLDVEIRYQNLWVDFW